MKKRFLPRIFVLILCLVMLCPLCVRGVTPLDPDAQASLTLHYQKEGMAFADLPIGIYRVAKALPDGSFQLIEPFASYPINIHGITAQQQWHHVAQTLQAYLVADRVEPDFAVPTDENGKVCFSGLRTGLYYVREAVAESTDGTYVFNQFMVYVPTPQSEGGYVYDVVAKPKCTDFVPKDQYSVTKLWQDAGNQAIRPQAVTVAIYKDGALQETQTLNPDNNWTYTWYVSGEESGIWTVVETSVPDVYKVSISQNGSHFSIINTYQAAQETPKTGDSFTPMLWVALLCFSGIMLVILGIARRRRK